jgi:DivIVA domain-containing protein
MGLTPDDIRTRQFQVGIRGFDSTEVRSFLAEVAAALDDERDRADRLPPPDKLHGYVGDTVASVLRAADAASQEIIHQAERQAAEIHAQATAQARELWDQAEQQVSETLGEAVATRHEEIQKLADAREQHAATLEDLRFREQRLADGWAKLRRSAARFSERVAAVGPAADSVKVDDIDLREGKQKASGGRRSKVD